jgi:hypothetical protein
MSDAADGTAQPTRVRNILAAIVVAITVLAVWKVIDYRSQPPPPPHPIGEIQPDEG